MKHFAFVCICAFLFVSCGRFLWFSDPPEPDLGPIKKVMISLSPDALKKLYATVVEDDYAPCVYTENGGSSEAEIRVRGFTSRLYPKKSFTVRVKHDGKTEKYAIADSSISNRLVFDAYTRAGLHVPETEGVALFINGEYLGCYTRMPLYDRDVLRKAYHGIPGELFMGYMIDMGYDHPIRCKSEKKFPDDNDFSGLETLVYNVVFMNDADWNYWMDGNIDRDEVVRYMVVHDFFAVRDTHLTNYCIYDYGRMFLLPWDHELCMNLAGFRGMGGDTPLTRRLMSDPYIQSQYIATMNAMFIDSGDENILDEILDDLDTMCTEVDRAVFYDPTYYLHYDDFISEQARMRDFLEHRNETIDLSTLPSSP
jgi:spore coat protein CotH